MIIESNIEICACKCEKIEEFIIFRGFVFMESEYED